MSSDADLRTIRIVAMPLEVWKRAQEHADELIREFALINIELSAGGDTTHLPARLLELIDSLTATYSQVTSEQERIRDEAVDRGEPTVDLTYELPVEVREATIALGQMLDECDDYCRAGERLLTLATPPEAKAFRDWYLDEFVRQIDGLPPTPWPESEQARSLVTT